MPLALACHTARLPELVPGDRSAYASFEVSAGGSANSWADGRAPLCLALAIDASSSMRGARFALALQATRDVLASLGPQDRVAVVTFERQAQLVLSPTAFAEGGAAVARTALDRIGTGVGTNLGAGWREAADALLRVAVPDAVRRVLLLTDGYPSRGDTALDVLRERVADGRARGVETSVLGLGDGIDDNLCAALAEAGQGRFHYVRDESGLADVVGAEVGGARSVAATDVTLTLAFTPRLERAEVVHRYPCRGVEGGTEVRIGSVMRASPRSALVAFTMRDGTPDAMLGFATAAGRVVQTAAAQLTAVGHGGNRSGDEASAAQDRESVRVPIVFEAGSGTDAARRRVAVELVTQRVLGEVRSAWNAADRGDHESLRRRLDRARSLRRRALETGLARSADVAHLPDIDALERAMRSSGPAAGEARRQFRSLAHNTQLSLGELPIPVAPKR